MEKLGVLSDIQTCIPGEMISYVLRFLIIIDFDFETFTISLRLYEQNASHFISGGSDLTLARLWRVSFSLSTCIHPCIYILNGSPAINGA